MKSKLHALSYKSNGIPYSITIEGCHEEVHQHARNLGLTYDGIICEQIPLTDAEMERLTRYANDE